MSYKSLRDFIKFLEKEKDLVRIKQPISTVLEMTEIQSRTIKKSGPALLFENPITENGKSNIPVLVNLFGTVTRVAQGMNSEVSNLRKIGEELALLKSPTLPSNFKEVTKIFPTLGNVMNMRSINIKNASCQEIILRGDDIDLSKLPIQSCWPDEPSPLITWPLVVTKGSVSESNDIYNLGIYRMQVIGRNKTLMRWLKHRGGARQYNNWKKKSNKPFPAAIVIGTDPATILSAVTPLPDTLSEYNFSGLLRGSKSELVKCITVPLKVPANSEIILEGHVSLEEYHDEGPYGDHTGYYNSVEKFPTFTISAITMRKNPIYLSTYTGRPPDEPSVLGEALNEIFVPLLIQQFPEITDFFLPPEGCSYRIAVVSIKKAYPGHARRIMMGIWSFLSQFLYTKFIIVVDDDINIRSWKDVMWAISTRMDPLRDTVMIDNTPIDYLDFASPESGLGSKAGLDATNKIFPETKRAWGKKIYMQKEIIEKIDKLWSELNIC